MEKTYDLYEFKNLSIDELRKCYRGVTGLDNDNEFTDEEIYNYLIKTLYEEEQILCQKSK